MPAIIRAALLLCAMGSLATHQVVYGQSLGEAMVLSSLGDPVEVEIPLSDWHGIDLKRVQVAGANRQQYEAFKLRYLPIHDSMSFNLIGPNSNGEVTILVSSRRPVVEPYVELLLSLRWPEGSTLREYVLLFDPPRLRQSTAEATGSQLDSVAPLKADPALAVRDPAPAVQPKPKPEPLKDESAKGVGPKAELAKSEATTAVPKLEPSRIAPENPRPASKAPEESPRKQYRVKSTDSLWTIARQFQPTGIGTNAYQFMLGLYELNKQAFLDGNLAMLKADSLLEIPAARDVVAVNAGTAQQIFERRWREALVNGVNTPPAEATAIAGGSAKQVANIEQAKTPEPAKLPGVERIESKPAESILAPVQSVSGPSTARTAPAPAENPVSVASPPAATAILPAPLVATTAVPPPASPLPVTAPLSSSRVAAPAPLKTDSVANPFLVQITETAGAIQGMLQTRYQRLQELERQILQMQTQLQQAQQIAGSKRQAREELQAAATRKAVFLGLIAAGLIIAMGFMLKLAWQWNQETKRLTASRRR